MSAVRQAVAGPAAPVDEAPELSAGDLLHDLDTLARLLDRFVRRESWLDAYLVAAGMVQVAEDWLHEPPAALDYALRLAAGAAPRRYRRLFDQRRRAVLAAVRAAGPAGAAGGWRTEALGLLDALAGAIGGEGARPGTAGRAARLASGVERLPGPLRRQRLRLPAAFFRFDLRPVDLDRMAADFAARHPSLGRPVAVLGVRTSGSYTAPLLAARLRDLGCPATSFTHRPGERWLAPDARWLRAIAAAGGTAAVCDDPPHTGGSVLAAAAALEQLGFPPGRVVLLLPLAPGARELPARLERYPAVVLPHREWSVHGRLESRAVEDDLAGLLGGLSRARVLERLEVETSARGHVRGLYRVSLDDRTCTVAAEGIGLGYFGQHSLAVAGRLAAHLPATLGARDGIIYREWLPESRRVGAEWGGAAAATAVARYVDDRARVLATAGDASRGIGRRGSAWKAAGDLLATGFGRAMPAARPLLQAAARDLLEARRTAVVDGRMGRESWFRGDSGRLLKVSADRGAFAATDLYCYDPAFDLAGAATGAPADLGRLLRAAYELETGTRVDAERWLLYRLLHLRQRLPERHPAPGADRQVAAALQEYYAETIFADTRAPATGPLCAVDLDGVLETPGLGFPGTTPSGALALRALARHGYRVLLATGRNVEEVRDRCRSYPVVAGVAEYGAALILNAAGDAVSLASEPQRAAVDDLRRAALAAGLRIDPARGGSLRVACAEPGGPLDATALERLLGQASPPGFQVFAGAAQTDLVPVGIDKGRAALDLARRLGGGGAGRPLVLAVGDTEADLPLLALAELPLLTANASGRARESGHPLLGQPCQRGFAMAVERLLGHPPGGCRECRPPTFSARQRLLLRALDAPQWPGAGKVVPGLSVVLALRRQRSA